MFKDRSLKSKLVFFAGLIFCSNFFLSLPLRSASALAAWAVTSNGSLKLRTSSGTKLEAFFQSSIKDKGERVWVDFPGELSRPRTLKGNGSVKEIRLGKPSEGRTRLVIEFLKILPSSIERKELLSKPINFNSHVFGEIPINFNFEGSNLTEGKNSTTSLVLPLKGLPNLTSFTEPLPFIILGRLNSPGKSIQTLSPLSLLDDWKKASNFVPEEVLNLRLPLLVIAHAASALADLRGKERKKLEHKINPAKNANFDFKDWTLNIKEKALFFDV